MRTTNLQTRLNQIVAETLRQIAELQSVEQYVRTEDGDTAELLRWRGYAHQTASAIKSVRSVNEVDK